MPIVPIRSDNAYVGIAKQTTQGTPVAPSTFVRWLDGTKFEYDLKVDDVWEGDGTRHLSQLIKTKQSVKANIVFNPRPIELGFFETAAMGIAADTVTAPVASTTFAALATVGSSTISLTASTGLTSVGTATLVLTPGGAAEEVVTVTTPGTGSGPYVYTLTASAVTKNAHANADAVRTAATHTIVDQTDGNYYTVEFGLGSLSGSNGVTIRITDCKLDQIKRSSKSGMLLEYSLDFIGIACVVQAAASTVTYENHNAFLFTQGSWTLNGSATGDALAVESFDIQQKNGVDAVQTEQVILSALIFGNLNIDVKANIVMQNPNLIGLTYWGGSTAGGATDSQTIGAGNLTLKFTQADGFHSVQYFVPTMHYQKITEPAPKKDGKHYNLGIEAIGVSNQSANTYILQTIVTNGQTTAY